MNQKQVVTAIIISLSGASIALGFGGNNGTVCPTPVGPDVIVGDLSDVGNYTSLNGIEAFAIGTTSCNVGNQNVLWQASNPNHPVIGQSIYKLKNGRFEQLGMSWLKHGFTALTGNICGCGCSGQGGSVLGVGCSDPYGSGLNGDQGNLGPRWQVNAHTGVFPYPPANPAWTGSVARRIQVKITDLEPSSASVLYFGEAQYVTKDDATAGNQNNNPSYRPISMTGSGSAWSGTFTGSTIRMKPAIRAWKVNDPTVTETDIQVPGDGLFVLSAKATNLGGGLWHYEYALQNVNSDLSGGSFTVPVPASAFASNLGFHDVSYHDGDGPGNVNFDGADWTNTNNGSATSWGTVQSFAQNPNGNALRWGTLYNFRFDANRPPQSGSVTIGLFKSGGSVNAISIVPGEDCNSNNVADSIDISNGTSFDADLNGVPDECEQCVADISPDGGNGEVDADDLLAVINAWGTCAAPCPADIAPLGGNGEVNVDDLVAVIIAWGGCS